MVKLFAQNKKALILAIGMGLILSLAPFYFVEASPGPAEFCGCEGIESINPVCWIKCVAGYTISLPVRIIFFVIVGSLGIGALIAGLIYAINAILLNWLIGFILSVGIVPGNDLTPQIVTAGWDFSRQFANMFFVLALAFIGLATILRIKEYEAKKALPTLIIIALLINFTPVIVGFIVDMGNLVTKFFLDRMGGIKILSDVMNETGSYLINSIRDIFTVDGTFLEPEGFLNVMSKLLGIAIYGLVLLVFFFLAGFIYLLISAVFFCRTVILWVLMILSPIAFLSRVFPDTKTTKMIFPDILHWDKWWEKLIQWTIIGIPIGFFLYLSNSILLAKGDFADKFGVGNLETGLVEMANSTSLGDVQLSNVINQTFASFFASLLAPTLSLMLLIMGALISFKAVPEGAKNIMRFTTEKGRARWPQKGLVGGTTAGLNAIRNIRQTYQEQRGLGVTRGQAFIRTAATPIRAFWQKKQSSATPSTTPGGGTPPPLPSGGGTNAGGIGTTPPIIPTYDPNEYFDQVADQATTPTVTRRQKVGRIAKKIGIGATLGAAKIGLRAATGILKATEDIAKTQIEKEMKIGKHKEKGGKTKNCLYCLKEIPIDSKFCPYCREPLE